MSRYAGTPEETSTTERQDDVDVDTESPTSAETVTGEVTVTNNDGGTSAELLERITRLKDTLDRLQQDQRNKNMIIAGLRSQQQNVEDVTNLFQNLLKEPLYERDIESARNLGKNKQGLTLTKVVFRSLETRLKVYKARVNLKDRKERIFFNEDLTKRRERISYIA